MKNVHLEMPFHWIQKWTGKYFCPGSLWKHKVDEHLRLQDTYHDGRVDTDITAEQRNGGVEEHFDVDQIIDELEKEEARYAHSGEEDLDGANEEDNGKAGLSKVLIDHPNTPSMDPDQNPYVLFVHTNGLHLLPYIQSSFTIFKTMFTFDFLEDFHLANLESSAYQYYQLLRQKTEPLATQVVIEQYAKLWHLSRCW
ncbi:hypothetical protein BDN71DRAFT_1435010 [Pleurotus eryngii]|uniref:Uncharacterized protein n=1 Tax=Pleurotus eryngii TaxID=5323 RepID=A0A9P6D2G9_PLEER|nr:hypothetical protein BDN71DRAFT_1435010 [Pleurotus eryngii]